MNWTVRLADEAVKQLRAIPPDRRRRILDDIRELEVDPFLGMVKPLVGKHLKGRYRKVSGRYRIIFKPHNANRLVEVLLVLLRNEKTYR
jgi:mRNA-degrading endonuclease RelE of RelBE toxin-antitoxin system